MHRLSLTPSPRSCKSGRRHTPTTPRRVQRRLMRCRPAQALLLSVALIGCGLGTAHGDEREQGGAKQECDAARLAYGPQVESCVDDPNIDCVNLAADGECRNNLEFMERRCSESCGVCDLQDHYKRCGMPSHTQQLALPAGRLSAIFERASSQEFDELQPTVLSRDPWVVSFDRFLSEEEVDAIKALGAGRLTPTVDYGSAGPSARDGQHEQFEENVPRIRTSWYLYLNESQFASPLVRKVYERIANVTRVPVDNMEFMQLLRYEACDDPTHTSCQFYRCHLDDIPALANMVPGPRIFTMFLYLSDVEEGGETQFDSGMTVTPRAGKALFWSSVLEGDPFEMDPRSYHQARPVLRGEKHAANIWLHQFDWRTPQRLNCHSLPVVAKDFAPLHVRPTGVCAKEFQ
jgi:prolyl 4-hydroxylase